MLFPIVQAPVIPSYLKKLQGPWGMFYGLLGAVVFAIIIVNLLPESLQENTWLFSLIQAVLMILPILVITIIWRAKLDRDGFPVIGSMSIDEDSLTIRKEDKVQYIKLDDVSRIDVYFGPGVKGHLLYVPTDYSEVPILRVLITQAKGQIEEHVNRLSTGNGTQLDFIDELEAIRKHHVDLHRKIQLWEKY